MLGRGKIYREITMGDSSVPPGFEGDDDDRVNVVTGPDTFLALAVFLAVAIGIAGLVLLALYVH